MTTRAEAQVMETASRFWWVWLVAGILWIIVSIVILQFDITSAATVGIVVGIMFLVAGMQYFFVGSQIDGGWKWFWFIFGAILLIAGLFALFYPTRTFLAIANILGFVFALIGALWIVEAFVARDGNDLWWLTLIAGIIMVALGFWLGGQFLITKAETLLIFAGVFALLRGITDIITAFQVRKLGTG